MGYLTLKHSALLAVCFVYILSSCSVFSQNAPQILDISSKGEIGKDADLSCSVAQENATVEWLFNGAPLISGARVKQVDTEKALQEKDLDGNTMKYKLSNLTVLSVQASDSGNYTCIATLGDKKSMASTVLDLRFPGKLISSTEGPIKLNSTDMANVTLKCIFEAYNATEVKWWKRGKEEDYIDLVSKTPKQINIKQIESTHDLHVKRPEENGTYVCQIWDSVTNVNITGETDVIVYAAPKVIIDLVKAISSTQLFLNWTVHAYNLPIKGYNLMYRKLPSSESFNQYTKEKIGIKNTSFVLEGLDNSTEYQVKIEVTTTYGSSQPYMYPIIVKTLDKDPVFVPNISINGFSATSVTIAWAAPSEDIAEYIHYYLLEARKKDETASKKAYHSRDNRNLPYMFDDLEPYSTYIFRVRACSEFTRQCGNWSAEMEANTLDGTPGKPSNVTLQCYEADVRARGMKLTWEPPIKPNAEIRGYMMEITSNSTYKDRAGVMKQETLGPSAKSFSNSSNNYRADDLKPNTNYTVRLAAMTRSRRRGEEVVSYCRTSPAPPDHPPKPKWRKIMDNDRYLFKTLIPRISERNGPICCYRVYMVRMPNGYDWSKLPEPQDLPVISYEEAHSVQNPLGAYVTDVFSNHKYPTDSELIMGDGGSLVDNRVCDKCMKKPKPTYKEHFLPVVTSTVSTTTKEDDYDEGDSTTEPEQVENRERRSYGSGREDYRYQSYYKFGDSIDIYRENPMLSDGPSPVLSGDEALDIRDGPLDSESNYTLFVELIPGTDAKPEYSIYQPPQQAKPSPPPPPPPFDILELVLQVTCGILAVVLLGMVIFCIHHTTKSRKMPPHAHIEINPIQAAFRYVEQVLTGTRSSPAAPPPPDLPPIPRSQLPLAYAERQADSDYGFQKEFELLQMLPDCFPERTTTASDARENQHKNRYPDIKAYDQTRVKLTQLEGIVGSDYINANYVMGYKERKQFICAQGPTVVTVDDFWRMIWEQRLELVVMLTNLEEYSKVKCSRYWPDESATRAFGDVHVTHVKEKRYSDYIVRELKITKQQYNSEGQPIVETNGVAKRNGDCNSAAASPREKADNSRTVLQYHFLVWKDFAAPEHAHSLLKFIKRMNEAWLEMSGRPILVHCSAGVGRTGTLVALDCLLQQLNEENQVAVFNCVAGLRAQRNFLVQSLKQYVFVYRALVEYAHYGDTEIPASKLKSTIDKLRNTPDNADKCLMELEFEKMLNSPVSEPIKSCAAGTAEELRNKNRSPDCLPYDRNRVILAPMPGRDYSTYINASFIEAYDNTEGFIITQDPLPNTITDFWRMISEHNVTTIVMLSEIGEGDRKCPRYWEDQEAQYEHLTVQYEESECLPYFTRRRFTLTDNKSGSVSTVRHLQYHGWPTSVGHVPEVTRGLADLAAAATTTTTTLLAHCHTGTERAPLFVGLCVLISQLRAERRVDVSCLARNIRSQRERTIDTFLQYEFLYRAILNYAELHNLMDDS